MNLQKSFFERIRQKHQSEDENLARELTKLLNLSEASAYRRINGQTPLTFDELQQLTNYYRISIDEFFAFAELEGKPHLAFSWQSGFDQEHAYRGFLTWLLNDLEQTHDQKTRIIFHAKDFPVFFNFVFPEIGEFKSFFWQKTLMRVEGFKYKKYACEHLPSDNLDLGQRIFRRYSELDSMELWNDEVLTSILKQISYCHEVGYMSTKQDTIILLQKLKELVCLWRDMAEEGKKHVPARPGEGGGKFELYQNEIILGDNSILLEQGHDRRIYLSQNIIQGLITTDRQFVENSWQMKTNLFKNSMLLSNSAERERMKYFSGLISRIESVGNALHLKVD